MRSVDIVVIGGGLSGSATALGLVREGAGKVVLLDEQLSSQRLSRGNYGLTGFMSKGANSPVYAKWCRMATDQWPDFAGELEAETGYDVELEWTGGAIHAFGQEQFDTFAKSVETLRSVCEGAGMDYPVRMLNRDEFAAMVPGMALGEEVSGAMYTAEQGHVNPLTLLAALRLAFLKKGGEYHGSCSVSAIKPRKDRSVVVKTADGDISCRQVVVAAGHGSTRLLAPLGEKLNIYPLRGQLMVTERYRKRVLELPILAVKQTADNTFMIGLSTEDTAMNYGVTPEAMQDQASIAIRLFPMLANLNWVRAWGAIRVMTPDGGPIYSRLEEHSNVVVLALHSAVSLTPLATNCIAPWILGRSAAPEIAHFSNGRFNV